MLPMTQVMQSPGSVTRYAIQLRARIADFLRTWSASRTNYWLSYAIDFAAPIVFGYFAIEQSLAWGTLVVSAVLGALLFTFIEYALHRWYFHAPGTIQGAIHDQHHKQPQELVALPCIASVFTTYGLWLASEPVLGADVASAVLCGTHAAYFWYSALHHLEHRVRIKTVTGRWLRQRWIDHAVHHGRIDRNFGVTTSLWDRVLGTYHGVPRKRGA